jgi:hypothetical protein
MGQTPLIHFDPAKNLTILSATTEYLSWHFYYRNPDHAASCQGAALSGRSAPEAHCQAAAAGRCRRMQFDKRSRHLLPNVQTTSHAEITALRYFLHQNAVKPLRNGFFSPSGCVIGTEIGGITHGSKFNVKG